MISRPILAGLPVLAGALLLSACGQDEALKGDGRTASGEVLEGTISDGMIPLDELRSQAPLAEPEAPATPGDKAAPGKQPEAGAEAADAAATPAPISAPTPDSAADPVGAVVKSATEN